MSFDRSKSPVKLPSFDITDKVAIITGGTKGLGYAIVMAFAAAGAKVVITSRHQDDCEKVAEEVIALGGEALGVATDVQDKDQIDNLIAKTVEKFGRLDIMVNNAGVAITKKIIDVEEKDYDTVLNSNLKSVYFGSQAAARQIIKQNEAGEGFGGKIINMCSIGGIKGNNGVATYGASKAGAINLTKSLAWELARYGITANAICPGYVITEINRAQLEGTEFGAKQLKNIPLRRFGTVDEVAALALFLASDSCNMLDGEAIVCDMGATLGGNV